MKNIRSLEVKKKFKPFDELDKIFYYYHPYGVYHYDPKEYNEMQRKCLRFMFNRIDSDLEKYYLAAADILFGGSVNFVAGEYLNELVYGIEYSTISMANIEPFRLIIIPQYPQLIANIKIIHRDFGVFAKFNGDSDFDVTKPECYVEIDGYWVHKDTTYNDEIRDRNSEKPVIRIRQIETPAEKWVEKLAFKMEKVWMNRG